MPKEKRFLVSVGIKDLPFPIRVISKVNPEGQPTVASISINARIMQEFETQWIDKFIHIVHSHRERIGPKTLKVNIMDYLNELHATMVKIDFDYPFFIEKNTPVSKEKCLVSYQCSYSTKVPSIQENPSTILKMKIPIITTYPASKLEESNCLFGQLSVMDIEIESKKDFYPEDLVEIVDRHSLSPIYSFLTEKDQTYIIQKVHSEKKTSVISTDEIKDELAHNRNIEWYHICCSNFGMLHTYSTFIATEKSTWVQFSGYEEYEI